MILTKEIGDYTIYSDGKVISNKTYHKSMCRKERKIQLLPNGYHQIHLRINKKLKVYYIHRLVAECFILNPENKPEVNHKDGIKTNNDISNLEWVTRSENERHSYDVLGKKPRGIGKKNR